jgi:hypothetical protein
MTKFTYVESLEKPTIKQKRRHTHNFEFIQGMMWRDGKPVIGKPNRNIDSVWYCEGCHQAASLFDLMEVMMNPNVLARIKFRDLE